MPFGFSPEGIFKFSSNYFLFLNKTATFAVPKKIQLVKMANHKATKKDVRQSTARRDRNRYYGKTTRNAIRGILKLNEKNAAQEELPKVISMIDKLAKRRVIHKNKASNLKSKLVKKISALA